MEYGGHTGSVLEDNIQMRPTAKSSHINLQGSSSEETHGHSFTEQKTRVLADAETPTFVIVS